MNTRKFMLLIVVVLLLAALFASSALAGENGNFVAPLSADQEVPANDSLARGNAIFHISEAGDSIDFKLIVANIDNVTQSHIHCGAAGVNGPVVAFLYGFTPGGVTVNGVLSEGTITAGNVIPRPDSAACPGGVANLDDLIAKLSSGEAYVNVHTVEFPGGEIRGQFK